MFFLAKKTQMYTEAFSETFSMYWLPKDPHLYLVRGTPDGRHQIAAV